MELWDAYDDKLNRIDVYRIHKILSHDGFPGMEYEQKRVYAQKRLGKLHEIIDMPLETKAAEELWRSRLSFYIQFFEKLVSQIDNSKRITL